MKASNLIRVVASALVLSTLSFAAGVAGDLTLADGPTSGTRVVLRIPPELPANAVRAAPLPLLSTASAEAIPVSFTRIRTARFEPIDFLDAAYGHELDALATLPKAAVLAAPKGERRKGG